MRRRIAQFTVAALAGGAAALAFAQATPSIPPMPEPSPGDVRPLSEQPLATVSTGADGPNVDVAKAIVQDLAADPQLKGSKFTVAPEEGAILITGVTPKLVQKNRAAQIVTQHAGEGNVRNAIMVEEVFIAPIATGTDALAQADGTAAREGEESQDGPSGQQEGEPAQAEASASGKQAPA